MVVDGETGYVVPPGDAPALARAIGRYLDDPELGPRHGAAGRERCLAMFTVDRLGPEIEAVMQRLVVAG